VNVNVEGSSEDYEGGRHDQRHVPRQDMTDAKA